MRVPRLLPIEWTVGKSLVALCARLEYEVANAETIPNLGERRLEVSTEGSGTIRRMDYQVAEVHKALLCIAKVTDQNYDVLFSKHGGYIMDLDTGEKIPMRRVGDLYKLKMWVRQARQNNSPPTFRRQG